MVSQVNFMGKTLSFRFACRLREVRVSWTWRASGRTIRGWLFVSCCCAGLSSQLDPKLRVCGIENTPKFRNSSPEQNQCQARSRKKRLEQQILVGSVVGSTSSKSLRNAGLLWLTGFDIGFSNCLQHFGREFERVHPRYDPTCTINPFLRDTG